MNTLAVPWSGEQLLCADSSYLRTGGASIRGNVLICEAVLGGQHRCCAGVHAVMELQPEPIFWELEGWTGLVESALGVAGGKEQSVGAVLALPL